MTALRDEAMVREMLVEASRAAWAQAAVLAGPAASLYCPAESQFSRTKSVNCPQHKCDVCDARRVLARANDAAAHDEEATRILAAHPAPSTPDEAEAERIGLKVEEAIINAGFEVPDASGCDSGDPADYIAAQVSLVLARASDRIEESCVPSELLNHAVSMAEQAWQQTVNMYGVAGSEAEAADHFSAAVRERLAQSASIAACNLATNTQAAELMSAAEWLGMEGRRLAIRTTDDGNRLEWSARLPGAHGTAPTLHLAILAAARSLGWPGGGR